MSNPNPSNFQTVEQEFLDVMPTTLRLYQTTGVDVYGKVTHATTYSTVPCHLKSMTINFTKDTGETILASGIAYLGHVVPWLTVDDKLELPTGTGGWESAPIAAVNPAYGPDGIHHQELWFGGRGAIRANTYQ